MNRRRKLNRSVASRRAPNRPGKRMCVLRNRDDTNVRSRLNQVFNETMCLLEGEK